MKESIKKLRFSLSILFLMNSVFCMDIPKQAEEFVRDSDILRFLHMKEDRLQDLQRRVKNKLIQNYLEGEGKELAAQIDEFDAKLPGYKDLIGKSIASLSRDDQADIRGFLLEITNIKSKFQNNSERIPRTPPTKFLGKGIFPDELLRSFTAIMTKINIKEAEFFNQTVPICDLINKNVVIFAPHENIQQLPCLYQSYITSYYNDKYEAKNAVNLCGWYGTYFLMALSESMKMNRTDFENLREVVNARDSFHSFLDKAYSFFRKEIGATDSFSDMLAFNLHRVMRGMPEVINNLPRGKAVLSYNTASKKISPNIIGEHKIIQNGLFAALISVDTVAVENLEKISKQQGEKYGRLGNILGGHYIAGLFQFFSDGSIKLIIADSLGVDRSKDIPVHEVYKWVAQESRSWKKEGALIEVKVATPPLPSKEPEAKDLGERLAWAHAKTRGLGTTLEEQEILLREAAERKTAKIKKPQPTKPSGKTAEELERERRTAEEEMIRRVMEESKREAEDQERKEREETERAVREAERLVVEEKRKEELIRKIEEVKRLAELKRQLEEQKRAAAKDEAKDPLVKSLIDLRSKLDALQKALALLAGG